MRRFVIIGRTATASPSFSLDDLPSTSGRLDVLLRCVRAALLVSHGVRRDTVVYLVLLGGGDAPKTLRFDGESARFLRPDERSLAINVQKALAAAVPVELAPTAVFTEVRPAICVARGGLAAVLADLPPCAKYMLELGGEDIRATALNESEQAFFIGDHIGFDQAARDRLRHAGVKALSLGPLALHAEDAITVTCNELDRNARE